MFDWQELSTDSVAVRITIFSLVWTVSNSKINHNFNHYLKSGICSHVKTCNISPSDKIEIQMIGGIPYRVTCNMTALLHLPLASAQVLWYLMHPSKWKLESLQSSSTVYCVRICASACVCSCLCILCVFVLMGLWRCVSVCASKTVCVCVCVPMDVYVVQVWVPVGAHVCAYGCVCVHMWVPVGVYIQFVPMSNVYMCTHVWVPVGVYVCTCVCMWQWAVCVCVYMHVCKRMCKYVDKQELHVPCGNTEIAHNGGLYSVSLVGLGNQPCGSNLAIFFRKTQKG